MNPQQTTQVSALYEVVPINEVPEKRLIPETWVQGFTMGPNVWLRPIASLPAAPGWVKAVTENIQERIAQLNKADADSCEDRWNMELPATVRQLAREASNEFMHRRQELQDVLKILSESIPQESREDKAELLAWASIFIGALRELVRLKDLKDTVGKTSEYEDCQPKAWYLAKEALENWDRLGTYGLRPPTIKSATPTASAEPERKNPSPFEAPRKEMIYQRNVQCPYSSDSQSEVAYYKGFEECWETFFTLAGAVEGKGAVHFAEYIDTQCKKELNYYKVKGVDNKAYTIEELFKGPYQEYP